MYKLSFQFKPGFHGGKPVATATWQKALNPATASKMTSKTLTTLRETENNCTTCKPE